MEPRHYFILGIIAVVIIAIYAFLVVTSNREYFLNHLRIGDIVKYGKTRRRGKVMAIGLTMVRVLDVDDLTYEWVELNDIYRC